MRELECLSSRIVESSKSIQALSHPHPSQTSSDSTKHTRRLFPRWTRSQLIMPQNEVPIKQRSPTLSRLQRKMWSQGRRRGSRRRLVLMIVGDLEVRSDQAPRTHGPLATSLGRRSFQVGSGMMTKRRKNLRRVGGSQRDQGSTSRNLILHRNLQRKLERRKRRGRNGKRSRLLEGEPTRDGGVVV